MGSPSGKDVSSDNGGFAKVGNGVYLRRAPSGSTGNTNDPTLVLTFGWMGAKTSHIFKYTNYHAEIYPAADQIIVTSEPSFFWSSEQKNRKRLSPVIDALTALGLLYSSADTNTPSTHRILIHAFSNGGSAQLLCLSRLLSSLPSHINRAPVTSAIVFDSCPGIGTFVHSFRAFYAQFAPKSRSIISLLLIRPLFRLLTTLLVSILYLRLQPVLLFKRFFRGSSKSNTLEYTDRVVPGLASPILLTYSSHPRALTSASTPRLYIYSKTDRVVPGYIVAEHIQEAKVNGNTDIREEVFENTEHVMHGRSDPERYWGAVKAVWKDAVGKAQDS